MADPRDPRDPSAVSFSDASAHESALESATSPGSPKDAASKNKKHGPGAFFRELPVLILIAFGLALLIKSFFVQAFFIPSESMLPTLRIGDRVLVNKMVYRFREPRRGEIVVFVAEPDTVKRNVFQRVVRSLTEGLGGAQPAERDYIKRVIALPGETISIKEGVVTITPASGKAFALKEPYLEQPLDTSSFGPFTVPANSYFLLGDNRANSSDSRVNTFGGLCSQPPCAIPKSRIVGKAFVTIWPFSRLSGHGAPSYEALFGTTSSWDSAA